MSYEQSAKGLKLKLGQWHFRLWKYGWEIQNGFKGRVYFFPWAPKPFYFKKDLK